MNTTDPRSIARRIRHVLKLHARTGHTAIRLPDDAAQLVAEVLEHYAATTTEPTHVPPFDRPAVMWRDAAAEVAKATALSQADAVNMTEAASDALGILPMWRFTADDGPRYLSFTGAEVRQIVRYAVKRCEP